MTTFKVGDKVLAPDCKGCYRHKAVIRKLRTIGGIPKAEIATTITGIRYTQWIKLNVLKEVPA